MKNFSELRVSQMVREVVRHLLVNRIAGCIVWPRPIRWRMLRLIGLSVQPSSIAAGVYFGSRQVEIGRDARINREAFVDGSAPVVIGRDAAVGMRAILLTGAHQQGGPTRRLGPLAARPVVVDDGAWIGASALVMPGVTVGKGCIVAAGAVVTSDCAPNGLYVGSPARRVRDLPT